MVDSIEKNSATDLVRDTISVISRHIRTQELGPGDRLPSETGLAKELKVSRSVVREAYRSLAAMRLIDQNVGKRATVARIDHGAMSLMIEHGVVTEQINVQQIYDVRRTIETRTVTLAALRRTDAEAKAILHHAQEMQAQIAHADLIMEHDLAFHLEIAKASKNPVFAMIVGAFQGVSRQTWPIGWKSRALKADRIAITATHIQIAEAILVGDPQTASTLMCRHFDESVKAIVSAGLT